MTSTKGVDLHDGIRVGWCEKLKRKIL